VIFINYLLNQSIGNKIEENVCDINGKKYQSIVQIVSPIGKEYISRNLTDEGYNNNCGLLKSTGRVYGNGKELFQLVYYELLDATLDECEKWQDIDKLTFSHLIFLDDFNKRFFDSFTVIENADTAYKRTE